MPRETSGLTHRQARCQDICQEAPAEEDEEGEGEDEEPEEEGEEEEKDRETSPGTSVGFTRFVGMTCFEYHVCPPTSQGFLWASRALWRTWETFREQNIPRGGVFEQAQRDGTSKPSHAFRAATCLKLALEMRRERHRGQDEIREQRVCPGTGRRPSIRTVVSHRPGVPCRVPVQMGSCEYRVMPRSILQGRQIEVSGGSLRPHSGATFAEATSVRTQAPHLRI